VLGDDDATPIEEDRHVHSTVKESMDNHDSLEFEADDSGDSMVTDYTTHFEHTEQHAYNDSNSAARSLMQFKTDYHLSQKALDHVIEMNQLFVRDCCQNIKNDLSRIFEKHCVANKCREEVRKRMDEYMKNHSRGCTLLINKRNTYQQIFPS